MLRTSLALALCLPSAAMAQGVASPPLLPANLEVPLVLDQEVSSKRVEVGDGFDVSVARDVWMGGQLVFPRGARGRGVVAWKTGKGAFGKSGKLEIELRSVEIAGQLVPLTGKYRQEGEGNTAATVGTIVAAGVIAGMFVTGHSAVFAQGTELRGYTAAPFAAVQPNPVVRQQFAAAVTPAAATGATAQPVAAGPQVVLASASVAAPMAFAPPVPVATVAKPYAARPVAAAAPRVVLASTSVAAPMAPAPSAPVAIMSPVAFHAAPPAAQPRAPLAIAYATASEDQEDQFARLLRAQQGVHGRDARQGWTISD